MLLLAKLSLNDVNIGGVEEQPGTPDTPDTPVPDLCSELTLLSLPTELIQEIAWLSYNPNLYLVNHSLHQRLICPKAFAEDLAFLLFCDRRGEKSGWYTTSPPWRTSPARRWNLELGKEERGLAQETFFESDYINGSRLVQMIRVLLRTWVEIHFPFATNLSSRQMKRLRTYLDTPSDACLRSDLQTPVSCGKDHLVEDRSSNKLLLSNDGCMSVYKDNSRYRTPKPIVSILRVPTRILTQEKKDGIDELGKTLLYRTKLDSLDHLIIKKYVATAKPAWMDA